MNSSVLKQSRERTETGANRFMEQGFSTIPGLGWSKNFNKNVSKCSVRNFSLFWTILFLVLTDL